MIDNKRFKMYTVCALRWVSGVVLGFSMYKFDDSSMSLVWVSLVYLSFIITIYSSVSRNDIELNKSIEESNMKLAQIPRYELLSKSYGDYKSANILIDNNLLNNGHIELTRAFH